MEGNWDVHFDPVWGGPTVVSFETLEDWVTRKEEGIKYYSGTAIYKKRSTFQAREAGSESTSTLEP